MSAEPQPISTVSDVGWSLEEAAAAVKKTVNAIKYRVSRYPFTRAKDGGLEPTRFVNEWITHRQVGSGGGRPRRSSNGLPPSPKNKEAGDLLTQQARVKLQHERERVRLAQLRRRRLAGKLADVEEAVEFFSGLMTEASEAIVSFPSVKAVDLADRWGLDAALVERDLEEVLREYMTGLTAGILERTERFQQRQDGRGGA